MLEESDRERERENGKENGGVEIDDCINECLFVQYNEWYAMIGWHLC